ncbi:clan AA aspartic protease [Kovacikia minuta CCNUW1]|uniref:clan AA aspartic protease n=1 Tax=Kovacikia minuta TaxID=2931930 RepID=UPI001CCC3B81|nr:clan AA aspartic protease [Kovacikia minuta]UBF26217.1 clan AA aspartic protease [Kovacikia minuta CCNUW1]
MISGTIVGLQARISITLYSPESTRVEIECVVDTGFEGFLTLPPAIVLDLGLPYISPIDANLADDSLITASVHQGIVLWSGVERVIPVLAMGRRPLIGTALLEDYHLSIDFCEGGTVLVDEIL